MPSSPTPGSSTSNRSRHRRRHRPSPCSDRLGTPEKSRNPFHARELFRGFSGSHIATACQVACPPDGSDRIAPAIEGFYFWASGRSVTLPASRYNYSSDWTPLLVRLSLTGMAASLAAPDGRPTACPHSRIAAGQWQNWASSGAGGNLTTVTAGPASPRYAAWPAQSRRHRLAR
jgi:hypothetical protein